MRSTLVLAILACIVVSAHAAPNKREPAALVMLIDRSGSMEGARLTAVKAALEAAIKALEPDDQIAVIAYNSDAATIVPLQKVSASATTRDALIDHIEAGGGTNFAPPIKLAGKLLAGAKTATRHVILISDGETAYDGLESLVHDLHHGQHITLSTIGIGDADPKLLELLSNAGGGRSYNVADLGFLSKVVVREIHATVTP